MKSSKAKRQRRSVKDTVDVHQEFEMTYKVEREIAGDVYYALLSEFFSQIFPKAIKRAICDPVWREKKSAWWWKHGPSQGNMNYLIYESAPVTKGSAK
jgi:hypothetical protein